MPKRIMTLLIAATLAGGFFARDAQAFSGGTTHGLGGYTPSESSSLGPEIHSVRRSGGHEFCYGGDSDCGPYGCRYLWQSQIHCY